MANTFYKPKNEYGELLASREYVNIEIADNINNLRNELSSDITDTNKQIGILEAKHEDDILNLSKDFENKNTEITESIIELENKQYFTFTPIFNQPIEEYIASLHSLDNFDPVAFKIKIGQTIYLRKTGAGETDEYEEYICINPYDYIPEAQNYSALVFNRLGAVEAIVASNRRHGSVRLLDSIYNVENWEEFRHEEKGTSPVSYAPSEGVAVAPYALKDFKDADNALKDKDIELEGAIAETNLKVEEIGNRTTDNEAKIKSIIDELGGIIEDNKAEITDSRMDKNEADISANKELIDELRKVVGLGPHDCNSSSASCNCGHECKFDTNEDCCLICKVNNLDEAVNTNADSLVELSDALDNFKENTESSLETNTNSILNLETIIGTKKDTTKEQSLSGYVAELDSLSQSLQSQIADNDIDISKIYSEIGDPSNNNPSNENSASLWANILQHREDIKVSSNAIKTINDNLEIINNTIPDINAAIKSANTDINNLFNEKADASKVTAEIQSVTKQIEEAEDKVTNINKEIGDKTSSDTPDTLWGSAKVNGEKIDRLELLLGNKKDSDSSDSAWANINKLQLGLDNLKTEVNEKITQTIEPFESRIEMLEDFNKVRNIVITTEIPANEGEFLELKYSDILGNIIPTGNWSNYEIIVNGIKIEDIDNVTGEIYTISAWPSITYIKSKANDSNGAQFNKIRFDFADNDSIGHKTYISMTIYDVTQHENYIHL